MVASHIYNLAIIHYVGEFEYWFSEVGERHYQWDYTLGSIAYIHIKV